MEILIDDVIYAYYGISAERIRKELEAVQSGEDVKITIHSAGGSVSEGVAIFNLIREFARTHTVSVYIQGLAASMASYVALAAKMGNPDNKIIVEDNSIFMIHNAWTSVEGDYREFGKTAQWLERLSALLASAYASVTGQTKEKIRKCMDDETYFVGQEIVDFGFADEVAKSGADAAALDRKALVAEARLAFEAGLGKAVPAEERKQIAAVLAAVKIENSAMPGNGGAKNKEDRMSVDEIKAKYPDEYAAIFADGEKSGMAKERTRVSAHLKAGEVAGALDLAAKNIRDGKSFADEEVQAEYFEAGMKKKMAGARQDDRVPPIAVPEGKTAQDVMMDAFNEELGLKE